MQNSSIHTVAARIVSERDCALLCNQHFSIGNQHSSIGNQDSSIENFSLTDLRSGSPPALAPTNTPPKTTVIAALVILVLFWGVQR